MVWLVTPVALPPGGFRLATHASRAGSPPFWKTIGNHKQAEDPAEGTARAKNENGAAEGALPPRRALRNSTT
jgi:hypothetical protein